MAYRYNIVSRVPQLAVLWSAACSSVVSASRVQFGGRAYVQQGLVWQLWLTRLVSTPRQTQVGTVRGTDRVRRHGNRDSASVRQNPIQQRAIQQCAAGMCVGMIGVAATQGVARVAEFH